MKKKKIITIIVIAAIVYGIAAIAYGLLTSYALTDFFYTFSAQRPCNTPSGVETFFNENKDDLQTIADYLSEHKNYTSIKSSSMYGMYELEGFNSHRHGVFFFFFYFHCNDDRFDSDFEDLFYTVFKGKKVTVVNKQSYVEFFMYTGLGGIALCYSKYGFDANENHVEYFDEIAIRINDNWVVVVMD